MRLALLIVECDGTFPFLASVAYVLELSFRREKDARVTEVFRSRFCGREFSRWSLPLFFSGDRE